MSWSTSELGDLRAWFKSCVDDLQESLKWMKQETQEQLQECWERLEWLENEVKAMQRKGVANNGK